MAFCFAHHGELWIVLDDENVSRIQKHDPFEFTSAKSPVPLTLSVPLKIRIAYVSVDDYGRVPSLMADLDALARFLSRGFTVTASDNDRGYPLYDGLNDGKRKH